MKPASVLLENPKSPYNVGGALRACHVFGAAFLTWSGTRVMDSKDVVRATGAKSGRNKYRLPREERMKEYEHVSWGRIRMGPAQWVESEAEEGVVPVCVEVMEGAERLDEFVHPEDAIYVFGPEDSGVGKDVKARCHRFLTVPTSTRTPLNLAATVNLVLYDRFSKGRQA